MATGEDWIRAAPASRTWKQKDYAHILYEGSALVNTALWMV